MTTLIRKLPRTLARPRGLLAARMTIMPPQNAGVSASRLENASAMMINKDIGGFYLQMPRFSSSDAIGGNEEENNQEGEGEERDGGFFDPKDRSRKIPVELSIKYMNSTSYREAYGDHKIWELYRRNYPKGSVTWAKTRQSCIKNDRLVTGNPCPICRDEYLVVDYRNVDLIKQFISVYTGEILDSKKTMVCQKQHRKLLVALEKAKDYGLLDVDTRFVEYNYDDYKTTP